MISLIAAVASNGVIGRAGRLPWKLPGDLARFKGLTMGHPVIMGRSTFDSVGRILPGRTSIVLSRNRELKIAGCTVVHSAEDARRAAAAAPGSEEAFVIGGAEVYARFLPEAARLYLTRVEAAVQGDAAFPPVDWTQWRVTSERPGRGGSLPYRFVDYERAR